MIKTIPATACLGALLVTLLGACTSNPIDSSYDYNHQIDFTKYRTYAFIDDTPMAVSDTQGAVSPLLEGRIMEAVRMTMNSKGYSEVQNPDQADMVIAFTVGARDHIKVDSYPASYGAGYSRMGYYYGYGMATETRVRQYTKGQLAVDIFDVKSHTPAFHGVASKNISESDRKDQQPVINAVTAEALSGFPLLGGTVQPPK